MQKISPDMEYYPKKPENFLEDWKANFARLVELDEKAKAQGTIIGRYIWEPYADGRAYYQIRGIDRGSVFIKSVKGLGDDWTIPYWGESAWIHKDYAEQKIRGREAIAALFSKKGA